MSVTTMFVTIHKIMTAPYNPVFTNYYESKTDIYCVLA